MGLSYAPFEDLSAPRPPSFIPEYVTQKKVSLPEQDATECNWLVMFFVVGVFALALADSMKSS